ncbi:MAG: tripartite tricarboxylate transporter substrate binding protein [Pseudomonadota bacterium]
MKKFVIAAAAALLASLAAGVSAQEGPFPSKPIRIIVPLAPGGATDTIARIVGKQLSIALNTPVLIENRTGAGGIIGLDAAARAPKDGYTLFAGNVSTNAINQTIFADKLKFKVVDALQPISMMATIPHTVTVSNLFEPKTIAEFVAYAKAHPGKVNYATPGAGSYPQIDMMNFERAAGLQMVHVPYAGGVGQYLVPMSANEVQVGFINASSVIEMIKGGRLRALAVTTEQRLPELPNVPTLAESGYPNIGTNAWNALFAPAGTPQPVIDKLFAGVLQALNSPEVKESFAKILITPAPSKSPAEFDAFIRSETARWGDLVTKLGVKVEN